MKKSSQEIVKAWEKKQELNLSIDEFIIKTIANEFLLESTYLSSWSNQENTYPIGVIPGILIQT